MDKITSDGYIKMIAINIHDLESYIIDERNTNFLSDVKMFHDKYEHNPNVKCIYIHMDSKYDVNLVDYQKVYPQIHAFDYLRDLLRKKSGRLIKGSDRYMITDKKRDFSDYIDLNETL